MNFDIIFSDTIFLDILQPNFRMNFQEMRSQLILYGSFFTEYTMFVNILQLFKMIIPSSIEEYYNFLNEYNEMGQRRRNVHFKTKVLYLWIRTRMNDFLKNIIYSIITPWLFVVFLTRPANCFLSLLFLFCIASKPNGLPISFEKSTISGLPEETILKRGGACTQNRS